MGVTMGFNPAAKFMAVFVLSYHLGNIFWETNNEIGQGCNPFFVNLSLGVQELLMTQEVEKYMNKITSQ